MAGYIYKGKSYSPGEVIEELIREGEASPAARDMDVEDVLDQIAGANAIDRETVGSDEFPKAA